MMRLSVVVLAVLALLVASEARLSKPSNHKKHLASNHKNQKKNRKLQNYNYGYYSTQTSSSGQQGGFYDNDGNWVNNNGNNNGNYNGQNQQAQGEQRDGGNGYYNSNGQWVNSEGGESMDEAQQQYNQYNRYGDYSSQNVDTTTDGEETDDMFRYENLTKENYLKLLDVHDKMEAYRLATILLCVIVFIMGITIAILNCMYSSQKRANMAANMSNNEIETPYTKATYGGDAVSDARSVSSKSVA